MDLNNLKALAAAATPGPWVWEIDPAGSDDLPKLRGAGDVAVCDFGNEGHFEQTAGTEPRAADMSYIAAANPSAVLSLIDQVDGSRFAAKQHLQTAETQSALLTAKDAEIAQLTACVIKHQGSIIERELAGDAAPVASVPIQSAELPKPFFYYRAEADGSVRWGEDCVSCDDPFTGECEDAEFPTHGGKVYSEAQMLAALAAPTAAPAQASSERCKCCGYAVTDSEHRGCLRAAQPEQAKPTDIVREAVEAAFEERAGWRAKIAAAVRHLATPAQEAKTEARIKSHAAVQNMELVLARLEQMHKDSVPGTRRDQIEEAMPCALAVLRHLTPSKGGA